MFCPDCGWKNSDASSACEMCGHQLPARSGRKAAAPPPPVVGAPGVTGPSIARLGDRMIAVVLDTVVLAAVFAVTGMWAAARWGGVSESGRNRMHNSDCRSLPSAGRFARTLSRWESVGKAPLRPAVGLG